MNEEINPVWVLAVVVVLIVLVVLFALPEFYRNPQPHIERMEQEAKPCLDGDLEACERLLELERQKYRR